MSRQVKDNAWTKPFLLTNKFKDFEKLPTFRKPRLKLNTPQQIFKINVPGFKIINNNPEQTQKQLVSQQATPLEYIRTFPSQVFPNKFHYELTDIDLNFLNQLKLRPNTLEIGSKELEQSLIFLQKMLEKDGRPKTQQMYELKSYLWELHGELSSEFDVLRLENSIKFIWSYWIKRREKLKGSLLKQFLKPEYINRDPHLAFRNRRDALRAEQRKPPPKPRNPEKLFNVIVKKSQQLSSLRLFEAMSIQSYIIQTRTAEEIRNRFLDFAYQLANLSENFYFTFPQVFLSPRIAAPSIEASNRKSYHIGCHNLDAACLLLQLIRCQIDIQNELESQDFDLTCSTKRIEIQKKLDELGFYGNTREISNTSNSIMEEEQQDETVTQTEKKQQHVYRRLRRLYRRHSEQKYVVRDLKKISEKYGIDIRLKRRRKLSDLIAQIGEEQSISNHSRNSLRN